MYSRAYSDRRFAAGEENISVPPRYGGVRFVKTKRSDGRESGFERSAVPMANEGGFEPVEEVISDTSEDATVLAEAADAAEAEVSESPLSMAEAVTERKTKNPLSEILKSLGEDDILIIAIILIIAAEKGENSREAILLLALLLCFR